VPVPVVALLTVDSLIVRSGTFLGAAAALAAAVDGEVLETVALAARRGREDEGVPGAEGAMGARVETAVVAPPDGRGPDGRAAAGVLGAEGAVGWVELSRRPEGGNQSNITGKK